jgi:hypothetical protein
MKGGIGKSQLSRTSSKVHSPTKNNLTQTGNQRNRPGLNSTDTLYKTGLGSTETINESSRDEKTFDRGFCNQMKQQEKKEYQVKDATDISKMGMASVQSESFKISFVSDQSLQDID